MLYFAGDYHFGSERVRERQRPEFEDLESMDRGLIEIYNQTIRPSDDVIFVGDFSEYSAFKTVSLLKKMAGRKHLVIGNNDNYLRDDMVKNAGVFVTINETLNYKDKDSCRWFYICHYPMLSWKGCDKGAIHIHAHLHTAEIKQAPEDALDELDQGVIYLKNAYDVGIDHHGLAPVSAQTVLADTKAGKCTVLTRRFFRVPGGKK